MASPAPDSSCAAFFGSCWVVFSSGGFSGVAEALPSTLPRFCGLETPSCGRRGRGLEQRRCRRSRCPSRQYTAEDWHSVTVRQTRYLQRTRFMLLNKWAFSLSRVQLEAWGRRDVPPSSSYYHALVYASHANLDMFKSKEQMTSNLAPKLQ